MVKQQDLGAGPLLGAQIPLNTRPELWVTLNKLHPGHIFSWIFIFLLVFALGSHRIPLLTHLGIPST